MKISGIHQADRELRTRWTSRFAGLPPSARQALRAALRELAVDAAAKAQHSWERSKAPMAVYWKVLGVYAKHLAAALNRSAPQPCSAPLVAELELASGEQIAVYRDPGGGLFAVDSSFVQQCFGEDDQIVMLSPLGHLVELVESDAPAAA